MWRPNYYTMHNTLLIKKQRGPRGQLKTRRQNRLCNRAHTRQGKGNMEGRFGSNQGENKDQSSFRRCFDVGRAAAGCRASTLVGTALCHTCMPAILSACITIICWSSLWSSSYCIVAVGWLAVSGATRIKGFAEFILIAMTWTIQIQSTAERSSSVSLLIWHASSDWKCPSSRWNMLSTLLNISTLHFDGTRICSIPYCLHTSSCTSDLHSCINSMFLLY